MHIIGWSFMFIYIHNPFLLNQIHEIAITVYHKHFQFHKTKKYKNITSSNTGPNFNNPLMACINYRVYSGQE